MSDAGKPVWDSVTIQWPLSPCIFVEYCTGSLSLQGS